ncbi:hypothetical protein [Sulfurimonas sp.]|jgi:hypothetical protein|uniref:hypothetical protein n=1 Tax=Sulfurimonas sp. TaxID=2022749 RepID=UPI0025FC36C1|nr:hypothetical protein [Sulfurimonas sp.]MCK9473067.1 hypothetical protein [Sulfurimonas sp.]MDD3505780.1 hypothetical protein [Sulfurimonas sp.]
MLRDEIYLDKAFIIELYEEHFGKEAPIKYSKTTDVSVGINVVAKVGASLKETFEYSVNTHEMYLKLKDKLNTIEEISLKDNDIKDLPDLFWIEGLFGITQSSSTDENNVLKFSFCAEVDKKIIFLATNNVYFSSGYDQLLNFTHVVHRYGIKAKMLLKFLGNSKNFSLASPMIVIKTGNYEHEENARAK